MQLRLKEVFGRQISLIGRVADVQIVKMKLCKVKMQVRLHFSGKCVQFPSSDVRTLLYLAVYFSYFNFALKLRTLHVRLYIIMQFQEIFGPSNETVCAVSIGHRGLLESYTMNLSLWKYLDSDSEKLDSSLSNLTNNQCVLIDKIHCLEKKLCTEFTNKIGASVSP